MSFHLTSQPSNKKMTIALLVYMEPIANTVYDHIYSFLKFSKHNIQIYNLFNSHQLDVEKILSSEIIVIHYTVSLFSNHRFPLFLKYVLSQFSGLKIIFIQDEYRLIDIVHSGLNYLKIDILFTCVPELEIEKVYPTYKLPFLRKKINVLTGYVPENLLPLFHQRLSYKERKMDIVYRARKLSSWYGRLGQDKWKIVPKFLEATKKYKLNTDLSYQEKDRIYGNDWIKFLQNSKAALGVESGANVFDFTGRIQQNVENYEKENPTASFEEIESKFFSGLDGKIHINQISPRCFECAALGTLMILYEGDYSGILKPWRHYVPLKKDYTNINEVIKCLQNKKLWEQIILTTYNEIALNDEYSYKKMISHFDNAITEAYNFNNFKEKLPYLKISKINSISIRIRKFVILNTFFCILIMKKILKVGLKILKKFFRPYLPQRKRDFITPISQSNASLLEYFQHVKNHWILIHTSEGHVFNFRLSIHLVRLYVLMMPFNFPFKLLLEIFKTDLLAMENAGISYFNLLIEESKLVISFDEKNNFKQSLIDRFYKLKTHLKKVDQIDLDFPMVTIILPENLCGFKNSFLRKPLTK